MSMSLLDPAKYKWPTATSLKTSPSKRLPKHRTGEWFIKGPIPGWWLGEASKLPGKSLHVALAAWHKAQLTKRTRAILTNKTLEQFGVSRWAAYAALEQLEAAGLVEVDRHNGRCPRVTICNREDVQ